MFASGIQHEDPGHFDLKNVYDFTTFKERGLAVIINNENFDKAEDGRDGSSHDVIALRKTFQKLGFDVRILNDKSAKEMYTDLEKVGKSYDHANACCFVCCILTHGGETFVGATSRSQDKEYRMDVLFGVDGVTVPTENILQLFNDENCPGLTGKPRLFFIEACRGKKRDRGLDLLVIPQWSDGVDIGNSQIPASSTQQNLMKTYSPDALPEVNGSVQDESAIPAPLYKDSLVMYATTQGYAAWLERSSGSWFVQSLCEVLNGMSTHRWSLLQALVQVNGKIALDPKHDCVRFGDPDTRGIRQASAIESMLVKDIFFS